MLLLPLSACKVREGGETIKLQNTDVSPSTTPSQEQKIEVKIGGEADLKGLKISVQQGTTGHDCARDVVGEGNENLIYAFARYLDAITALKQGKVDATIMDKLPAEAALVWNTDLMILPTPLSEEPLALAFKLDDTELADAANKVIAELQASGQIDKWIQAYFENEEQAAKELNFNVGAKGGKLVMGTESGFAPYETKLGNKVVGSDIALAAAIAKELDKELVVKDMDFDGLIAAVQQGQIDMIAAGFSKTEDRAKQVLFSDPYTVSYQVIVIRKTSEKK